MREGGLTEKLPALLAGKLSNRLDLLRRSVKQASIGELEEQVAKLMLAYPSTGGHGEIDAMLRVRQYSEDLLGTPLWAVKDACRDVSRGAVPGLNRDFAPSSPRLRELVDGYVSAVHKEAGDIKEVLHAPVVLPDNSEMAQKTREYIVNGFQALTQKLKDDEAALRGPVIPTEASKYKAPTIAQLKEIYASRKLPGIGESRAARNAVSQSPDLDEDFRNHLRDAVGQ
ncbi:hypothetical protein [Tardiphaga sp. P5_C7]